MAKLQPCAHCKRHVRRNATACPFCGADVEPSRRSTRPISRLARAAVFSWAIAGGVACGDDGGPSVDATTSQDAPVVAVDAGPNADAANDDAGVADAAPEDAAVTDAFVPLPYGAPPARRRLV